MSYKTTAKLENWRGREVKIKGKKVVGKSAFEIGLIVEGQAKALAPKDTGRLRGSITTQSYNKGTDIEAPAESGDKISAPQSPDEVYVGTAVIYGPYQEFGTVRNAAQSFLRPALDLARGRALTVIERNGRQEFKEYLR